MIKHWDALNDMVVSKGAIARMADFQSRLISSSLVRACGWHHRLNTNGFHRVQPGGRWTNCDAFSQRTGGDARLSSSADPPALLCQGFDGYDPYRGRSNLTYLTVDGQEAIELELVTKLSVAVGAQRTAVAPRRNGSLVYCAQAELGRTLAKQLSAKRNNGPADRMAEDLAVLSAIRRWASEAISGSVSP